MENKIELKLDNTITQLVGNSYGQSVCKEQICGKINFEQKNNVIVIPSNITRVGISFIQGLIYALPKEIPRNEFYKYFSIQGNESVKDKFREVITMGI